MRLLHQLVSRFFRGIEGWGLAPERERLLDARSAGPCARCGQERIRLRDVRIDDLGYSVRQRERWICGCDPGAEQARAR